ncbi:MAG: aminotransferase class V-fold PLP-dependent enzyme, partial [Rhizobiaceae bacterium]|nr:aminotransferase class V-fold PLP-dependent enzyme [Rhizobiaceae bacterium]
SGAEVVEVGESAQGGPDLERLEALLAETDAPRLTICSFSAASNVTGIVSNIVDVTRLAKAAGAKMVWDYAGAGPYLPIDMTPAPDCAIDAIVVSPHKFVGGPGSSGVLIVRRDAVTTCKPTWPGGGTVSFVSTSGHDYSTSLEAREEAGTPNVIGDIRAALAFLVKDAIGADDAASRNEWLASHAMTRLCAMSGIEVLGSLTASRLPIFSIRMKDGRGGYVHQQLVTRMLSDRFGIQARGGCACAGPYAHRLLDIGAEQSAVMRAAILAGEELEKPGFIRFNLSVLMTDDKVDYILRSIEELAKDAPTLASCCDVDPARAIFAPRAA